MSEGAECLDGPGGCLLIPYRMDEALGGLKWTGRHGRTWDSMVVYGRGGGGACRTNNRRMVNLDRTTCGNSTTANALTTKAAAYHITVVPVAGCTASFVHAGSATDRSTSGHASSSHSQQIRSNPSHSQQIRSNPTARCCVGSLCRTQPEITMAGWSGVMTFIPWL